ncbi:P1 family peptidase [Dactylosporangium sp. CA-092794]|uniref:DmpA family aminopeptidase n=1 Tax=Dactylosporangium sp. CA-092794 TaxID=3239929 RepID=UPI003D8E0C20
MDHHRTTPSGRVRARGLGIPLRGEPGAYNAITDVPGVEVGYTTLVEGADVRTGVTAVLPRPRPSLGVPCPAGWFSFNGNGEMTGTAWIEESGGLTGPIGITNTHAVGMVHAGIVEWMVRELPAVAERWLLPVVAETWDGYLNDINGRHVRPSHAVAALDAARPGPLDEGSVGGGTGMRCYGYKGGSGTASRMLSYAGERFTVGAFVQANFGARAELTIAGAPLGRSLPPVELDGDGSVIVVIATDAPLLPGQCKALARRATLGIGRTGTSGSHFSGDIFLALSTAAAESSGGFSVARFVPWEALDPFYAAVVESVEEAVLNALVANVPMTGRSGRHLDALPHDAVRAAFAAL